MIKSIFCLSVVAVSAYAAPQVVKTKFPTRDVVIAETVLAPPQGGDAAPMIQAAVDEVSKRGGGTVFLSAGGYTIASRVTVREGVTLRGDYSAVSPPLRSGKNPLGRAAHGTLLRITADRGDADAPATFLIERGSGLTGLTFLYPEQTLPDPVPYPWTVKNAPQGANDNQTVEDCTFVNAWQAICIGPDGNELHTLRNLYICALKTGISIDSTTDIGRISDVWISPQVWFWFNGGEAEPDRSLLTQVESFLLANDTVGVEIGRSDWEYIRRLNVDGYRRGLVFKKGKLGTTNAVMADSWLIGCRRALEIEALNEVGFSAYDCTFFGSERALSSGDGFETVAQFHSCEFRSPVVLRGKGGVVSFQASRLSSEADVTQGSVRVIQDGELAKPELRDVPRDCPRPKSDALFVVTDFGASPEKEDNAAAFQAALDLAAAKKGGTVYVPAGLYNFRGDVTVPAGVELRGSSDVPHHTVSAGSVLMPRHGQGREDGTPFVSLKAGAGLRGLTFWYPEQPARRPVPYPWTVRSLGKGCWLKDVTIGNAWQGVDFATHPSDGHFISYLAGSMFRRGLFVGRSGRGGRVEDVQFNPHYTARIPARLPHETGGQGGDLGTSIIQFQREHLEGLVFTDCTDERLVGTFLYAAFDGLAFRGKVSAQVLLHGTDTGSRGVSFATARGSKVDFALAQLVALGDWAQAAIVTDPANEGDVAFRNSQVWAGPATAWLMGRGNVRLEQFNTVSGPVNVRGGRAELVGGVFQRDPKPAHVDVGGKGAADVRGCIGKRGELKVVREERSGKK
ncbi:MAG: hypothetical protein LBW77_06670 [Verrucomicrobiota bacterium]|jgi:hypothetical protein|nr:hypothetical protein [Verrucomicrobiota bacterium]